MNIGFDKARVGWLVPRLIRRFNIATSAPMRSRQSFYNNRRNQC